MADEHRAPPSRTFTRPQYHFYGAEVELLLGCFNLGLSNNRTNAEYRLHFLFHFGEQYRIVLEVHLCILTTLPDALRAVTVPRSRLVDDTGFGGDIEHQRRVTYSLGVHDVEFRLLERRRHLVLHDLDAHVRANDVFLLLHSRDAPDVETYRCVELERLSTSGRLRIAEHHTDLLTQLVDEDDGRSGASDGAGELPQRLAHPPRLQPHVRVAHVAFDLRARHERGDRIDHHDVDGAGTYQDLTDLHRLLTRIRLRHEEIVDIHAQLLRIVGVERVLGIDVCGHAAGTLSVGDHVQAERRLATRLGAVDLGNPPARNSANSDCRVEVYRARWNCIYANA